MDKTLKSRTFFYGTGAVIIAIYAYLTLHAPVSRTTPSQFQLGSGLRLILQSSYVILIAFTWFFGTVAVRSGFIFAKKIQEKDFKKLLFNLSMGLGTLVLGFITATFVGQIRTYNPYDPNIVRTVSIIVNYIYVAAQFFGFWFLYRAVEKKMNVHYKNMIVSVIITLIIGIIWVGLIFTNPTRQISSVANINPTFYISDFLILYTIILPTLCGWFFGITASFDLADISIQSSNLKLQRSFSQLVSGVWLLVLSFIVLFGILSVGAQRLLAVGLSGVLIIIYAFVFIILSAFGYTALSLKKLEKQKGGELNTYESNK